ncbi:hypothetical protein GIW14_29345 [Pseudomonas edaphica]|nr:hypothetical protein [Pseudomonas edaphica]
MIRTGSEYRRIRPADLIEKNRTAYEFLREQLAIPYAGKTVVITHHCPIPEASGGEHSEHLSAGYFNRWHQLVDQSDVWIFGHTHYAIDQFFGRCRLISNPRGYPSEETGFDPSKILEI